MRFKLSLIILSFVQVTALVAQAATDVDTLAKDFEKQKEKVEAADLKQRQVLSALYQLNKKIKKSVSEKGNLSQQRSLLEMNVKNLENKVDEMSVRNKEQRTLLAERLRVIYKLGGQSLARMVFSSQSSAQMERNLKILGIVATKDLEMIKNYSQDLKDLQYRKKILAQRLENLKTVESRFVQQEKNLLNEQAMKNKILDGIRKSKLFAMNKMNGIREKSLQFNLDDSGLFDLLFKPSFADQKGELPPPLPGIVSKKFGLIKGEDHPYTFSNKGVFISSAKGTPIKAVFSGTVSYVGELPGFGPTLILDHGDHYYSVYSHAEDIKVAQGDEITQSQVLALVGAGKQDSPNGMYFEIRHFSEPYDPQQWMKGL